jgi:hypothetical protein
MFQRIRNTFVLKISAQMPENTSYGTTADVRRSEEIYRGILIKKQNIIFL